ncbi:serine hydrolase [Brachybacterium sp. P6-10-X1]|uniref:serine hydrolase n=1 Tax=Brachybacterium sp. P6-10-X1 TaxID=1903186 RepID=UPI000971961F|nr:serine hydrolase [Brachybacterium sp. P6-10-X1]APX33861.1 serine hydrolase [Brachybacterium sp. P6-10-X1]
MPIPTAAAPDHVAVSACLLDAEGAVLAADDADRPYYAASTIKLHVLLAALRAADAGSLDLDESVPATRTFLGAGSAPFTLGGDHLDPTHPADGDSVRVRELLTRMIDRSSNEATDHVIELIGLDAVADAITELGLTSTRVERMIGDASALAAGATNETSAADLARTMRALVRPTAELSPSSRGLARTALRAQQIPVIARALREGVPWGSKSGWVDGYRHDVAFLDDPDSPDVRFLAVMTAGLDPEDADVRILRVVRELCPDLSR